MDDCLQQFSRVGLRTLVLGRRDVSRSEKDKFLKAWRAAETATEDRKGRLAEAAALIERDFEIVGATAIEDRLQDGVPETIHELAKAEIKLWVLTGDKVETAINIAKSAKLLTDDMFLVKLPVCAPRPRLCLRCRGVGGHEIAIDTPRSRTARHDALSTPPRRRRDVSSSRRPRARRRAPRATGASARSSRRSKLWCKEQRRRTRRPFLQGRRCRSRHSENL